MGDVRDYRDHTATMPNVVLTQTQIDFITEACNTVVSEHARFLDDEVRRTLAQALRALGKREESFQLEP